MMCPVDWKNTHVVVTGASGFLGLHLVKALMRRGATVNTLHRDLRDADNANIKCDHAVVFHLAARVGGIGYNLKHPADIIYNNALVDTNVLYAASLARVRKIVCVGSVCAYPRYGPSPILERDFWNGEPEPTNAAYAHSKRLLLAQLQAYYQQYNLNFAYLVLANLYGPMQDSDPETAHVIPALIRKIKDKSTPEIPVWGTGSALRDFLWVEDAAEALVLAAEHETPPEPINVGSGRAISISSLVTTMKILANDFRPLAFDTLKPDGQAERLLDIHKAKEILGWQPRTSLEQGLKCLL